MVPHRKAGESKSKKDSKYVLTLKNGINAKTIDDRTNKISEIEEENKFNMDFNPKTDPRILK